MWYPESHSHFHHYCDLIKTWSVLDQWPLQSNRTSARDLWQGPQTHCNSPRSCSHSWGLNRKISHMQRNCSKSAC
jgi:hypothetical protein